MPTAQNCLSSVSLLPPTLNQIRAIIQGQWGPMVPFILQQRGKADNMGIYITPWLSRGLTFTNELILPNNIPLLEWHHSVFIR